MTGADQSCKAQFATAVRQLYRLFMDYNALLVEINPLATDEQGNLLALDGKVDIDDSALFKLPDIVAYRDHLQEDALVLEARKFNFLYIPVEEDGDIAVMSNGSGPFDELHRPAGQEGHGGCRRAGSRRRRYGGSH